jgi:hypothetical protein
MWTALTRTAAWAAIAVGLLAAAPAHAHPHAQTAPDPETLAAKCIQQVRQTSDDAADRNANTAARTSDAIAAADANGATDAQILRIADRGKDTIEANTRASIHRVRSLVERCLASLRRLDADPALADAVRTAGSRSVDRIQASAAQARAAITRAAADAVGN